MIDYASPRYTEIPTAAEAVKYLDWMRQHAYVDICASEHGWTGFYDDDVRIVSVGGDCGFAETVLRLYLAVRDAGE
jgi:hypothetical protein